MNTKFLSPFFKIIFVAAVMLSGSSCKKETDAVSESCRTVSVYNVDNASPYYTTYYYDEQGRISATLGKQIYSYITYTADSAIYKEYQLNGFLNASYSMKVDANGRFVTKDDIAFQYNADGNLIHQDAGTVTYDYTWQNGDMIKQQTTIGGVLSYTTNYTYYPEHENKAGWDYNHSGINCFFGGDSKLLIKHTQTVYNPTGVTQSETDWTYEFNEKGLPTQMKILFVGNGTFDTYLYNYECN